MPVLRAGLGMVDGFLRLLPDARVGHLGMQRDEEALSPTATTSACRPGWPRRRCSSWTRCSPPAAARSHALRPPARRPARARLRLVCLVAAPEGVAAVEAEHPDVPVWTAALDRQLDEHGYIRPGLGDAGDRVFGTTPE